jgi:chromosome partitioning related protein ParA
MELLNRLAPGETLGAALAPLKALIYRQDRTIDARAIAHDLREQFATADGRVSVLHTVVPHAKAYKEAATLRIPVHRHERRRRGATPSACAVMHQLAWELIPRLGGEFAGAFPYRNRVA